MREELATSPDASETGNGRVFLLVPGLDIATAEALRYVRAIRPSEVIALHPADGSRGDHVTERWQGWAGDAIPLEVRRGRHLAQIVREQLRSMGPRPHEVDGRDPGS